jgi:beta-glucosidase-like glycosyl hydrolase/CubicO group peptidase (beta-lactamase class C family)
MIMAWTSVIFMFFIFLRSKTAFMLHRSLLVLIIWFIPVLSWSQQDTDEQHWVDSVYNSLSPEERIAQLMIVRANEPGKEYDDKIEEYIREYNIGGVCFFRNHPHHQAKTTNAWQSMAKTPLLISIDAEWGLGMRLDSTTVFPFQMGLGAITDNELIYRMGSMIAEECSRIGVHMNFAPVVDINSNPDNPVIGMRSFGQDRENVARKGLAYMEGLQNKGVIATAKHFPGHGDTDTDSHKTLPLIAHSEQRLDSIELYPFRKLIDDGLGGIMIAHLFIPAYEKEEGVASTLSQNIVDGLLRGKLGFDGLIVTDALDMRGVTKYHKAGEIELQALKAGNDILLLPADIPRALKRISSAVKDNTVAETMIEDRCKKVLAYKYRAGLNEYNAIELTGLHHDLNSSAAQSLNRELFEASATLIRNDNDLIPLDRLDTLKTAYVACGGGLDEDRFGSIMGLYTGIEYFELPASPRKKDNDKLLASLEDFNLIIVGVLNTNIYAYKDYGIDDETWSFIRQVGKEKKLILDLFASPYALSALGSAELPDAIIISYQDDELAQEAGAQLIFGGIPARGVLPVDIEGLYQAGAGIQTEKIRLGFTDPACFGIADSMIVKADSIALSGIELKAYPGCQVIAAKDGKIFYHRNFGYHTYDNDKAVRDTDLYDLASLTKIAATTLAVMDLSAGGQIDIDRKLSYYLPYLKGTNKEQLIIREMMAHQSRFRTWIPYFRYTIGEVTPQNIYSDEFSEEYPVRVAEGLYIRRDYYHDILDSIRFSGLRKGMDYKYSDLGFYLLKEAVETITNRPFEKYVSEKYYLPLGLPTMGYLPLHRFEKDRIVPTENDTEFRRQLLQGDVHDQGAAMLGGVSGHAGLFSDAFDMAVIMQLFLDGGTYGGKTYLEKEVLDEFTRTQFPLNGNRRGVGFDKPLLEYEEDGPTCRSASHASFGHSGFTGTYAWADPRNGLVYIFLSNRVCPDANNAKIMEYDIRTNLHQVFYDAIENSKR